MSDNPDRLVTVCAACFRASCWQGKFYCSDASSAGIVVMPVSTLQAIDREHSDYWQEESSDHERGR